jgi:hypothetical protein
MAHRLCGRSSRHSTVFGTRISTPCYRVIGAGSLGSGKPRKLIETCVVFCASINRSNKKGYCDCVNYLI